jgi:hypothetical protein
MLMRPDDDWTAISSAWTTERAHDVASHRPHLAPD